MKKGAGKQKGGEFERYISKILSLWWTQDLDKPRDDIFWRTAGSGARATNRTKQKKKTAYEYGDITFIDPVGKPLIDTFLIECKKGYTKEVDILDLFHNKNSILFTWWSKALSEMEDAGRKNCILILGRNRKSEICFINTSFFNDDYNGTFFGDRIKLMSKDTNFFFTVIDFSDFLKWLNPNILKVRGQ